MAFLVDIGTTIVGKLVDLTVQPIIRQVGYVVYYNQNAKELEDKLKDLVAAGESVKQTVSEEERNLRKVDSHVDNWQKDVQTIIGEANKILKGEHKEKKKYLCGLCPNLVHRHQLSRRSIKLVTGIDDLYGKKNFSIIAHAITPQDVPTKSYEAFRSRTIVVNEIMDVFRNSPDVNMIGVYGFGGVGKTTLVKEVSRQAAAHKTLFDDVAMILDVKQNASIQRIQNEIAEKLDLKFPEDETIAGRARRLYSRIKDQKTLVILDDVWEEIDLEAVGLSGVATCKVLLTSRKLEVLSEKMGTQKEFLLDLLGEEESWDLFEKIVGDVIKENLAIKTIATKVARRCGRLPVLIVTVASALKNRSSVHVWSNALTRLKKFDKEVFTEKTYKALEWSYNQLDDEELKQLFLLCGFYILSPKIIHIEDLLKYGIGLGLFENQSTLVEAWAALNSRLEKLKDSCLVLDHETGGCLKMHDLVHDAAKRISSSKDQQVLKVSDGEELKEWPDNKDFCDKCTMIVLNTSNIPKLPEVLQCKELKFLNIDTGSEDYPLEIPCDFFKETTKLGVLDLSRLSLLSLPQSLQFLKNLKTLCLDGCTLGDIALIGQLQNLEVLSFQDSNFKELPKEIGQLTRLRLLDLTNCCQLKLVPQNVLSNLKRLEELKMRNSFNRWEAQGVSRTEKTNASLTELKLLPELSVLQIHILDASILPIDLFSNILERYQIYVGAAWKWEDEDANLNTLKLKLTTSDALDEAGVKMLLKKTDELYLDGTEAGNNDVLQLDGEALQRLKHFHVHKIEFRHLMKVKGVFPNLKRLVVSDVDGLRSLPSAMVRSLVQLTHLEISGCQSMEEIISTSECDEKHMNDMFSKLEHLELKDLPIITRFCSRGDAIESYNEIEESDSTENLGNAFFDKKVVFPSLKRLFIDGLTKVMTIWHDQLPPESFKILEKVDIRNCENLKSVFPFSMVGKLQYLMQLIVVSCGVVEIVAINEEGPQTTHEFTFSKVKYVEFEGLPDLKCFYSGVHVFWWPSLEELTVLGCLKVEYLAQECSSFENNWEPRSSTPTNQALFLINKDSFPNLKRLYMIHTEIWDGPFPVNYFSKLETLQVSSKHAKSTSVLEKFLGHDEKTTSGPLSHLSVLTLHSMGELMHLGEDKSQLAGQNFPNLTALWIDDCDGLRNLRSSAISFKNLTTLSIVDCWGLEYLITYSTAKSLIHLEYLAVKGCVKLVEIVNSTEDDHHGSGKEIVFSRLIYLELSELQSLRRFCSGDCIVKIPSLRTLSISKRLKLKIFDNDQVSVIEKDRLSMVVTEDTDEEADGESVTDENVEDTDEEANDGEQTDDEDTDAEDYDGEQTDESAQINNGNGDANFDGLEHVQTTASDQGVIAQVEEILAIIPVGQVTTRMLPVIEPLPVAEVPCTEEVGEQAFSCQNLKPLAEQEKPDVQEQSDPLEPSAAATGIPTPIIPALPRPSSPKSTLRVSTTKRIADLAVQELSKLPLILDKVEPVSQELTALHVTKQQVDTITGASGEQIDKTTEITHENEDANLDGSEHVQTSLEITATDQRVMAPVGKVTTPVFRVIEPPTVAKARHTEEVKDIAFSCQNLEPLAEAAMPHVNQISNAPEQPVEPSPAATETSSPILPVPLPSFNVYINGETVQITREKVNIDTDVGGKQVDDITQITNKNQDANVDGLEYDQPLKTTASVQRFIASVEENLPIIPIVTSPMFPVFEPSPVAEVCHTEEVKERAFSGQNLQLLAEEERPDVHQIPNAPEQSTVQEQGHPFEPLTAAKGTPTRTIAALPHPVSPKPSGAKQSFTQKLQALSSRKAASSSCVPEEAKAKLKALIATADLEDPHNRQQLLAVLPTFQLSTTKWIVDHVAQELPKLPLVLDKQKPLCQELADLKAQGAELDGRSQMLLSEASLAEENIQKVQEKKVELLALEEEMKKIEARVTSLRAVVAHGEKTYSALEDSLDQLVEEQQLNQVSMDSKKQELLRMQAESDSLCAVIFTYLRQLL